MKHIIINIGRQIGSGGHDVAKLLAERFDCRFFDCELLCLAAQESGLDERFFEQNDEKKGFFKSLFHINASHILTAGYNDNGLSQERLFQLQSDAIRKAAAESSCVFVGRCADYVLRDFEGVVNVFVSADIDDRIKNVAARKGCSPEVARKMIEQGENRRATYYNYYTGKRWGHCSSYDLCVNTSRMGIDDTAAYIAEFVERMTR